MRLRRDALLGILYVGLASACAGLATVQTGSVSPVVTRRGGFPEGQAAIEHLLLHFDPDGAHQAFPVYRDLARSLPSTVKITVAVSTSERARAALEVLGAAGIDASRIRVAITEAPVTLWARDRLVAVQGPGLELVTPAAASVVADRTGDLEVAKSIGQCLPRARHLETELWFEGGNILITRDRVFVGAGFESINNPELGHSRNPVVRLGSALGADAMVIGSQTAMPHEHIDMFMTVIDANTVLLGDPRLGRSLLAEIESMGLLDSALPDFDEWSTSVQDDHAPAYDAIARQLATAGFRVERIPILHGSGETMLTWNNALVELREDGRRAYVPVYGIPMLDEAALAVYRRLGCRTFPIDASRVAPLGGTVRCMVNVLEWRPVPARRESHVNLGAYVTGIVPGTIPIK